MTGGAGGMTGGAGGMTGGAGGMGGGKCNSLVNTAPLITETLETGTAPTLTGGDIPAGKYHITAQQVWGGGHTAGTVKDTLVIAGSSGSYTMEEVAAIYGQPQEWINWNLTTSGSTATLTPTCNGQTLPSYTYQVNNTTPVEVLLMIDTGPNQYLSTLTQQP
jgi:hypothetical protein